LGTDLTDFSSGFRFQLRKLVNECRVFCETVLTNACVSAVSNHFSNAKKFPLAPGFIVTDSLSQSPQAYVLLSHSIEPPWQGNALAPGGFAVYILRIRV
jgi:hypothetical protein